MDLDLAQVRAFVVTAEQRGFGRAAETLFLTQQALSKRVRRLEDTLSVRLFARTGRAIELTPDGAALLPHARELLRVQDEALASVGGDDRPLRVDLVDNRLSPMFVLRSLAERDPALRVERSGRSGLAAALDPLVRGEIDLAFGRVHDLGVPWPEELDHRVVRLEPLLALLPPEHPLAGGSAVRVEDLRTEGLWLPSLSGPAEFTGFLRNMSASLAVPVDTGGRSYDLRHTLEQARYGVPRVTLVGADMELPRDLNLRVLPFEPAPLFPWSVVWRRGGERADLRRFLTLAVATGRAEGWCAYDPARHWVPEDEGISPSAGTGTSR
ncbi:LysR family transcriptional regulator [Amycolatopsis antarctica]|uniref:LysR family transcriptional regulator n=1 Tax=Amycolatopsis antarctica TaxID=1854586 RepID=A0A263D1D5_9PSEU|nr:LysR family transcriptional regulator [Amycolatopsis antarctica]OZM72161.1 LysR family transcriptional regulator [Amycolatopsis antarctica]